MYKYNITGDGYGVILVRVTEIGTRIIVKQYYKRMGTVVKVTTSTYHVIGDKLDSVVTDDTDTLILPSEISLTITNKSFRGTHFRRLIVPANTHVTFKSGSCLDLQDFHEYISLSHDVVYEDDNVFSLRVIKRRM